MPPAKGGRARAAALVLLASLGHHSRVQLLLELVLVLGGLPADLSLLLGEVVVEVLHGA